MTAPRRSSSRPTQRRLFQTPSSSSPTREGLKVDAHYMRHAQSGIVVSTPSASIKTMFLNACRALEYRKSTFRRRPPRPGATPACVSRSRSITPDRWPITARWRRLRPRPHNLLTQLQQRCFINPEDVHVSIIPFSKDVNPGVPHTTSWIDFTEWDKKNGKWNDGVWTQRATTKWTGCVMDRDQNYDVNNTAPTSSNNASKFPAEQFSSCPVCPCPDDRQLDRAARSRR